MKDPKKSFALKKPCSNCPFKKGEGSIELNDGRREGIISDLITGRSTTFHCHKTVYRKDGRNHDEGNYTPNDVCQCPGAIALVNKFQRETKMAGIAISMGLIKPDHYDEAADLTIEPSDLDISYMFRND